MTIADALREANKRLERLDAEILLAASCKQDRAWLLAHATDPLSTPRLTRFRALVRRRVAHEPIAYILGMKEFYGRRFRVNSSVLIPRPDTELLIDHTPNADVIWDVGTGSGAIAVTLACKHPNAQVLATDIHDGSLRIARANAKTHHVPRITFLQSNLLQPPAYRWLAAHTPGKYLVICANLPYLPSSDAKKIDIDVDKFEPKRALYSGKDGLDLITRFLKQLARHLPEWNASSSTLLIEFDPPQATKLRTLIKKLFPRSSVMIHADLAGRKRLIELHPNLGTKSL